MIERAERLMKKNEELKNTLQSLMEELEVVTNERANLQEHYSQQMIIMNKRLEDMKQEKEQKSMNLEHNM